MSAVDKLMACLFPRYYVEFSVEAIGRYFLHVTFGTGANAQEVSGSPFTLQVRRTACPMLVVMVVIHVQTSHFVVEAVPTCDARSLSDSGDGAEA